MSKTDDGVVDSLLPLNAIRVFVEAARQLSFSRAARALGMTQSGVSHHMAALEKYLGHRLFVRTGSSLVLSDAGRQYFDTVQEAMSTIELSTRLIRQQPAKAGRLVVRTSLPTFAMTVLIPALPRFSADPAISVDLVTSLSAPGIGDVYDVLITRDLMRDNDEHWLLASETLVCVAAPALVFDYADKPLAEWPFLVAKSRPDVLAAWSNQQAIESRTLHVVGSFEHYFLALPAATAGMGFLVVPHDLVAELLRLGHLLETPLPAVRGAANYRAYVNPQTPVPEAAKAFCRWLKTLLRRDSELAEGA